MEREKLIGENIWVNYKGTENDIYTAEIGTFKMHVTPQKLWYVLWKFERLCNVKQADKIRFIYGQQEGKNISEKAMYLDKEGKAILRKKNLIKLSDNVAIEPNKKTKRYNMYYFVANMWYLLCQGFDESQYKAIKERIEKDDNYLWILLQKWNFNTNAPIQPIYKALFEALKAERINNTSKKESAKNKPENSAICYNTETDTHVKSESVEETHEDYPPEPYNEAKAEDLERAICSYVGKSANSCGNSCHVLPSYLRQKVFPSELFYERLKTSRFKPQYLFGLTSYHILKESSLERKRIRNTSVYSVLIRGETIIGSE